MVRLMSLEKARKLHFGHGAPEKHLPTPTWLRWNLAPRVPQYVCVLVEFRVIVTNDSAFGHDEDKNGAESVSNMLHITMWHVLVLCAGDFDQ